MMISCVVVFLAEFWVPFEGEFVVSFGNIGSRGISIDFQNLVIIHYINNMKRISEFQNALLKCIDLKHDPPSRRRTPTQLPLL